MFDRSAVRFSQISALNRIVAFKEIDMRTTRDLLFRYCVIAACSAIVANGCLIDRSPLRTPWATVAPQQYCAGDTLRASYQFFDGTCPAGLDCRPNFPNVVVSSSPSLFANTPFNAYQGAVDFAASGDSVAVTFDIDRDRVQIPMEGGGLRELTGIGDITARANRITTPIETLHDHPGMCSGASPTNAPAELPGLPRLSQNLRLDRLCNASGVVVVATLTGGASGASYTQMLAPNDCIDPRMPGVAAGIDASRIVEVRPLAVDPSTRCSATGPNNPPPALRTRSIMVCR
jgi:hypothetical protein